MPTNITQLKRKMRLDLQNEQIGPTAELRLEVQKAVAEFLYKSLLRTTPVKRGFLVGGLTFSEGDGSTTGNGRQNQYRIYPPTEAALLEGFKGVDIFISNDVDYANQKNMEKDFVELSFAELVTYASRQGIKVKW